MVVAACCVVGYVIAGITENVFITFIVAFIALLAVLTVLRKVTANEGAAEAEESA
jgi:uncharacterized membrane protein YedE/YeeE